MANSSTLSRHHDQPDDAPLSQAEMDRTIKESRKFADIEELLAEAKPHAPKSVLKMMKDVRRLGKGAGQLKYVEYFRWKLWEKSRGEQNTFLSEWSHWPIENACNDQEMAATTVAKWECTDILERADIATIPVSAMVDPGISDSSSTYGNTPHLRTGDDLLAFLNQSTLPLFAKPNALLGSFGALIISAVDGTDVHLSDGRVYTADAVIQDLFANEPYVLQEVLQNHASIREWAPNLATMRTLNFVGDSTLETPFAIFKIPCNGNIADNFWRDGNLLAEMDVATGEIVRVMRGEGINTVEFTHHPDTGHELVGTFAPFWEETMELNRATARLFPKLRYSTLDMSFTDDGPVVVEVNSGGSFDLPQLATGRGLLQPHIKDFISSCGYTFAR